MKKFSMMMAALLLALTTLGFSQVGDDMKKTADDAGKATKKAAKKTGHATKKA